MGLMSPPASIPDRTVAVRDLKNRLSEVLREVEAGERITVTVDRRPVAELVPLDRKPRWVTGRDLLGRLEGRHADTGMLDEIRELAGETIDQLDFASSTDAGGAARG
jgi:prevent-host-death family protein